MSKWREDHPKRPHQHDDLDHLDQPFAHLVTMHGSMPKIASILVQDGIEGCLIHGELPAVIHHRTDHADFAHELDPQESTVEP